MQEITPALVGIGLTLSAVFVPMAFFPGSVGVIYRQFSVTIVAAMALSVFVALTLTPALCATLLKPVDNNHAGHIRPGLLGIADRFFLWFNRHFERNAGRYQHAVGGLLRRSVRMLVLFLAIVAGMAWMFQRLPTSFLPVEDQGYLMVSVTLPSGATDARLAKVMEEIRLHFKDQPEIISTNAILGNSGNQSSGLVFVRLTPWAERPLPSQSAAAIAHKATEALAATVRDARVFVNMPSVVRGLGSSSGINFVIKDLNGLGHDALMNAMQAVIDAARDDAALANMRHSGFDNTSELKIAVDDRKAAALGVSLADINSVLSSALGSTYVNDFIHHGRVKRVYIQGDAPARMLPQDIGQWSVRNRNGDMVRLATFTSTYWSSGSPQLIRYNGSPALEMQANVPPGGSSGDAMRAVERIMTTLPPGIGLEWTAGSLQERQSGAQAPMLYAVSILFVFLCLAALYESWSVPFSVILAVPLGIVGALLATYTRGMANDVYFQVGLLTTVGLASKNAILIVEFAEQLLARGHSLLEATTQAVRLRLRPILMTSLAFGFGVLPLAIGTGAGAAGRNAIGTAVLGGMVLSTLLGIFFVPVFFVVVRRVFGRRGT